MAKNDQLTPILRTKLRAPRVTSKVIRRRRLNQLLDEYLELPVTLVSAPAGYGKSTLVAEWLTTSKDSSAWLSLDQTDSDLPIFLRYLLAAIETAAPGACEDLQSGLMFHELPPVATIARLLVNELDSLSEDIVIVLDDYHLIRDNAIQELLTEVLRYPPAPLHLVVVSRADPPLPLASIRATGRLGEVRAKDLQFTSGEVAELLSVGFELEFDDEVARRVQETTEGWPVALHLTALWLRDHQDAEAVLAHLGRGAVTMATELVSEVLSAQPAKYRDCLIRLSVLDRFSAPLCETVCGHADGDLPEGSGAEFIDWLERSDLFINVLDDERAWYRFHHLFRDFLTSELEDRCSADEIVAVHRRAADWFEANGLRR
jgi:LuxR family maltose regulon positive regulatory protein